MYTRSWLFYKQLEEPLFPLEVAYDPSGLDWVSNTKELVPVRITEHFTFYYNDNPLIYYPEVLDW